MSLVLRDVSNTAACLSAHTQSTDESSSCSKIASTSSSDISTPTTTIDAVDYDETVYDEVSVLSSDQIEEDVTVGEEGQARTRRRTRPSNLPQIFFGTPCQAEHERRAKYTTRMRDRRLLRKDSLELTRRKSIGEKRHSGAEVRTGESSREGSEAWAEGRSEREAIKKESSTLPSAEDDGWESDHSTHEVAELDAEEEETSLGDATVNEQMGGTASDEDEAIDSLPSSQDDLPSTPTKQIIPAVLSRQSLCLSDAESSPGVALGLSSAPSSSRRQSPFVRATPNRFQDENSPQLFRSCDLSPINVDAAMHEAEKTRPTLQSRDGQTVLKESPGKVNRSLSPSKGPQERSTVSPVKVVVRQTLSAWAHAKLKTPQSPEKKEWERMNAGREEQVAASPSRKKERQQLASSSSDRPAVEGEKLQVGPQRESKPIVPIKSQPKPGATKQAQAEAPKGFQRSSVQSSQPAFARPPSRIARPVPVSRIPRPGVKPAPAPTAPLSFTARRIQVVAPATPSYARIRNTLSSSSTSSASSSAHPVDKLKVSGAMRSPALPARADITRAAFKTATPSQSATQSPFVRKVGAAGVRTPSALSQSSSPNKPVRADIHPRSYPKSSPVVKRPAVASTSKVLSEPIVRDARLFAAASQKEAPPTPAGPVPIEPATAAMVVPPSPQSSDTSTFSAGVGAARRVMPGQERVQAFERVGPAAAGTDRSRTALPRTESKVDKAEVERRGARIKDITMGKTPRPVVEEVAAATSSDTSSSSSLSPPSSLEAEAAAITPPEMDMKGLERSPAAVGTEEKASQEGQQQQQHQQQHRHESQAIQQKSQFVHPIRKARTAAIAAAAAIPAKKTSVKHTSPAEVLPLSRTELSRLTSLHTRRNETFVSQIDTVVVRKVGENRPASPSSKIRKSDSAVSSTGAKGGKKAREDRAKRRAPDDGRVGGDESEAEEGKENADDKYLRRRHHALGPGETSHYTSPPRNVGSHIHKKENNKKSVRWNKALLLLPAPAHPSNSSSSTTSRSKLAPSKSCLPSGKQYALDHLGNILDANQPWSSPSLASRKRITVYKIIYDDDEP